MAIVGILFWLWVLFIGYVYLGYPLLIAGIAGLFGPTRKFAPKGMPPSKLLQVTLLIAAYNEEQVITEKLENSLALDYPPEKLHILVAADGSDDRTPEIVRAFADRGVELSYMKERAGKMAALNRAIPQARGEIVVFSDANNLYAPDALRWLVAPFADPQVGAVSGAKRVYTGGEGLGEAERLYWRYESFIKEKESRLGYCCGVSGEILAVRKSLFVPPPPEVINDDFYIAMQIIRQGYWLLYVPEARSYERVSPTVEAEMARRRRIVAGRFQAMRLAGQLLPLKRPLVVWQVVSHKFARPLVPWAMLGALVANVWLVVWPVSQKGSAWLSLASPWGEAFLAMQLGFYGLAMIGRWLSRSHLGKWLSLPMYLLFSNLAAMSGFFRWIAGRETALWHRAPREGAASYSRILASTENISSQEEKG